MLTRPRALTSIVAVLALAGGGVAAWQLHAPQIEPLAPLAVETLAPATGIELPHRVVGGGGTGGPAFSFDSPTEAMSGGSQLTIPLAGLPANKVVVLWGEHASTYDGGLAGFIDSLRRDPEDSHMERFVIEHSALGIAYRLDLTVPTVPVGSPMTRWYVEHDGMIYTFQWVRPAGDETSRDTVESMIASWRWS
ncbi:hypothetical protein [Cellulomonas sp. Leaf334]|uniref:hypothetical protein n=1 Tax=Cellulomonas sp. Leaf334 TaxID=1736339 RepID=UPI0006F856C5|nr:hypothetical protein [Cellulomonas sp. Leaf334]KQR10499.1 hypothetical protein ASF78_17620 [Cellulomonas sp. Leaf334]